MANSPTPSSMKTGDVIAGRYEIRGMIGRGGMGRIYRVFDKILGEEVALKTLLPDHVGDKVILDRFFNEAKIARSLSHPSIVRVHDIGQAGGLVYISMELLKGKSMRQMLDQVPPGQRLPIGAILRMFDALCAALDYAHRFTVHRDIKPENVMILENGSVKLMDFGISKLMSNPNLTSASIVMGTPTYMSPEQLKNTSKVDGRADVYSVGVMLYEALTGDRPTGMAQPASKLRGEVPAALDPIIEKCCQADPAKRYQSANDLRAALREVRIAVERKTGAGADSTAGANAGAAKPARVGSTVWRLALAAVLLTGIGAGAVAALGRAEARRSSIIAASAMAIDDPLQAEVESESPADRFRQLAAEVARLQKRAAAAAEDFSPAQRETLIDPVLALAATLWTSAESAATDEPDQALEFGWDAVACYLAPLLWPQGADMVFIPPSAPTEVGRARAFFIDARPVSADQWEQFRADAPWRVLAANDGIGDAPISGAAYFDATAYVASASPRKRLPTVEEYDRVLAVLSADGAQRVWPLGVTPTPLKASDDDPESDDGPPAAVRTVTPWFFLPGPESEGWGEWTSTPESGARAADATFGDLFMTWGGHWSEETNFAADAPVPMPYESALAEIGFRGVRDLPRTLPELRRAQ